MLRHNLSFNMRAAHYSGNNQGQPLNHINEENQKCFTVMKATMSNDSDSDKKPACLRETLPKLAKLIQSKCMQKHVDGPNVPSIDSEMSNESLRREPCCSRSQPSEATIRFRSTGTTACQQKHTHQARRKFLRPVRGIALTTAPGTLQTARDSFELNLSRLVPLTRESEDVKAVTSRALGVGSTGQIERRLSHPTNVGFPDLLPLVSKFSWDTEDYLDMQRRRDKVKPVPSIENFTSIINRGTAQLSNMFQFGKDEEDHQKASTGRSYPGKSCRSFSKWSKSSIVQPIQQLAGKKRPASLIDENKTMGPIEPASVGCRTWSSTFSKSRSRRHYRLKNTADTFNSTTPGSRRAMYRPETGATIFSFSRKRARHEPQTEVAHNALAPNTHHIKDSLPDLGSLCLNEKDHRSEAFRTLEGRPRTSTGPNPDNITFDEFVESLPSRVRDSPIGHGRLSTGSMFFGDWSAELISECRTYLQRVGDYDFPDIDSTFPAEESTREFF